ncbi:MAG TPA: PLP-dependent aminotransferase family protein [Steroidobacteraceae bacterium]|nr:PLP-dependent aminotransferase family protein [Steroidobacteraceae bacterium]
MSLSGDEPHEPLYRQIYDKLRARILSGELEVGERLPSSRDLADELRVSRNVVLLAYEQLGAEGYIRGRSGSGTYVSEGLAGSREGAPRRRASFELSRFGASAAARRAGLDSPRGGGHDFPYDFVYGQSNPQCFPLAIWQRVLRRHARRSAHVLDNGPVGGADSLREAICAHLKRARGVVCDPSRIVIVNGPQQALDLVVRVLLERGDHVAIEEPAHHGIRELLKFSGACLHPVPVDDKGLIPDRLPASARALFVTPSHQFPTGALLPLRRRRAVLDWAARTNAVIIENDCDGEFQYKERRLQPLQGLDTEGGVIYIGMLPRTIFPILRLGYLVLPPGMVSAFSAAKWLCDRHMATLEQEALADIITSGLYERHLRRVLRRSAAARTVLLEAVQEHLGDRVTLTGDGAAAHVVLWLDCHLSEESVIAAAAACGVRVDGVAPYFANSPRPGILLGYARLKDAEIREGIRRLAAVISATPAAGAFDRRAFLNAPAKAVG